MRGSLRDRLREVRAKAVAQLRSRPVQDDGEVVRRDAQLSPNLVARAFPQDLQLNGSSLRRDRPSTQRLTLRPTSALDSEAPAFSLSTVVRESKRSGATASARPTCLRASAAFRRRIPKRNVRTRDRPSKRGTISRKVAPSRRCPRRSQHAQPAMRRGSSRWWTRRPGRSSRVSLYASTTGPEHCADNRVHARRTPARFRPARDEQETLAAGNRRPRAAPATRSDERLTHRPSLTFY